MINTYVIDTSLPNFNAQKQVLESLISEAKKSKKDHSVAVKTYYEQSLISKTEYTYTFTE